MQSATVAYSLLDFVLAEAVELFLELMQLALLCRGEILRVGEILAILALVRGHQCSGLHARRERRRTMDGTVAAECKAALPMNSIDWSE